MSNIVSSNSTRANADWENKPPVPTDCSESTRPSTAFAIIDFISSYATYYTFLLLGPENRAHVGLYRRQRITQMAVFDFLGNC